MWEGRPGGYWTIVEMGKNSPEFEDEDLPDVTIVEDEEEPITKPKSFK